MSERNQFTASHAQPGMEPTTITDTVHLSAWLATQFAVAIKRGRIGNTSRKVVQGRALSPQTKRRWRSAANANEPKVCMQITINLNVEEARTNLAEHCANILGVGTEKIDVRIDAPIKVEQNVNVGSILNAIISPMIPFPSKKIEAIKLLRSLSNGMGLAEAKAAIENWDMFLVVSTANNSLRLSPTQEPNGHPVRS